MGCKDHLYSGRDLWTLSFHIYGKRQQGSIILSVLYEYTCQHTSYMRWLQYGVCFLVQVILVSCDRNTKERIGKGI